ncbi:unnamed protein product [Staurois parvus]|uniref:Hairy/enhancer-of-split related with YRPW motif protein 2 n=1 Tax=Staurois parvus TaxID=386267 RepID=A0ABN9CFU5_9NEOB|nr:unnamed protein product [Staurois parvus]
MKRPCDDTSSDSDLDETIDVGSENNYSGHSSGSLIRSNSPTTTSQIMARKKRRGIIEKRRRDRINNSLSELRRLVPTAFEKQGSAKLEKAEILQMTVDHLKMLQATGGKGYFDAHALAMDFMSIGFRECLTEVARYLSSVEGMDTSDPLRVRLVSHLSTCASQREAVAMTSSMTQHQHSLHPHHWATAFHQLPAALLQQNGLSSSDSIPCRLSTATEMPPQHGSALLTATFAHADAALRVPSVGTVASSVPPLSLLPPCCHFQPQYMLRLLLRHRASLCHLPELSQFFHRGQRQLWQLLQQPFLHPCLPRPARDKLVPAQIISHIDHGGLK